MILNFTNIGTEYIFNGNNTKNAKKILPSTLLSVAGRKLDQLDSVSKLDELKVPSENRFELLFGNRKGQFSIRINDQCRICFKWHETEPFDVEITGYH